MYFFRGEGQAAERLFAHSPAAIALPAVVLYELETGLAKSSDPARRRRQVEALVREVRVLPFGIEEARAAACVRAALEFAGTPIGPLDTLIAGTAVAHGAVVVTRNTREFGRVDGLRVDDWYGD